MEKNGKRSLEMIVDARVQGQGRPERRAEFGGLGAVTYRRRARCCPLSTDPPLLRVVLPLPAVPPLPLAGEGWGEGNLEEAPRQIALTIGTPRQRALTLPSPARGRGERRSM